MIQRRHRQKNFLGVAEHWKADFQRKKLFLFFDYDGTLTPIVAHFSLAHLSAHMRKHLAALSKQRGCRLAIVSGRSIVDLRRRVRLPGIIYVGHHGFEARGPKIRICYHISPSTRKVYQEIRKTLRAQFGTMPGVFLEDKGLTLSLHYRQLALGDQKKVVTFIRRHIISTMLGPEVVACWGKAVCEFRPSALWNKGLAVRRILKPYWKDILEKKMLACYIGDDKTDEDAFQELRSIAVTIHVGTRSATAARYRLRDVAEVEQWLMWIYQLRKKGVETC